METNVRANIGMLPMRSDIADDQQELFACQRGPVRKKRMGLETWAFKQSTQTFLITRSSCIGDAARGCRLAGNEGNRELR